jgi:hypothetical protein
MDAAFSLNATALTFVPEAASLAACFNRHRQARIERALA